jgi:NlpC/P60 family putative phage cell wall peptidase
VILDLTESETAARAAVVAEARKWTGTPYHESADIRGVGVDCGMLIVRVFVDLGLVPPFDPRPYARDWMLHNDEEKYLAWMQSFCAEVADPQPGDIAIFRFGRVYSHGGIVTQAAPVGLVHAYADCHCVIEESFAQNADLTKAARRPRFFSLWAK